MSRQVRLTRGQRKRLRRESKPIRSFNSKWRFLSNFYPAQVEFEGRLYATTEHAYQAAKFLDPEIRHRIAGEDTPGRAKHAARGLPLRPDWDRAKLEVMEQLVRQKFSHHQELKDLLVKTHPRPLVEGNRWHDNFWGDCGCGRCQEVIGLNHLGRILMKVREELL